MAYKITGKVVGEDGYPLNQIAQIKEVVVNASGTVSVPGSVWSDPDTGQFTFLATNENSVIVIESLFYEPQTFAAKTVPAVVRLKDKGVVIEAKTTKNYTIWWVLGGLAVLSGIALAGKKKAAAQPAGLSKPKKQPKSVVV